MGNGGWEAESEAGTGTDTVRNGFLSNYKLSHGWRRSAAELTPGLAFPVNAAANQTRLQSPPFSSFRPATLTHAARLSVRSLHPSLYPSTASLYLPPPPSFVSMSILLCFSPSSSYSSSTVRPSPPFSAVLSFTSALRTVVFPLLERSHGRKQELYS